MKHSQRLLLSTALLAPLIAATPAFAKGGDGGEGAATCDGAYTVVNQPDGRFQVQGRHSSFSVDPATFAMYDYVLNGTPVYASKVADLRGATLTGPLTVSVDGADFSATRSGSGVTMTIQAKDCASGGLFQMEPERADGTRTRIVHTLADGAFYYDNPNFRAQLGSFLGADCTSVTTGPAGEFCVKVTPRVNVGSDASPALVSRESAQVATRVAQPACGPDFTNALGLAETKDFCGGMSIWDVASGGRMGMVTGEDATEVGNPPTTCTHKCQGQDQVRGRLAVLGSPAVVPASSRLDPRTSADGLDSPLTAP